MGWALQVRENQMKVSDWTARFKPQLIASWDEESQTLQFRLEKPHARTSLGHGVIGFTRKLGTYPVLLVRRTKR